ncbi:dihydroxyacetone kinase subunit DhaK [Mycoplasma crocodyli]|uniref:Dihydroxyacetone (Glycerone) kinase, DhaK subunit n=1 Tax=Mycoplasma crocodyli (strain ATCC 51981 / MP145) TaxID=512564 RepID=D5E5M3_MYCCM|nr:dihydroxyacetone kinase subunit DhaK [Mycoplasma crocodyli]ADE19948.1 dihydroxyacetone (glycerone) kinase, DhaK subunit [Mycoplasma crocodyli MP145]
MKKLINKVENIVEEMCLGIAASHSDLVKKHPTHNIILRAKTNSKKVALISGGGSGHEPAHGGFVGEGMLDAAVAGEIFTSPTPDMVYEAIKAISSQKGTLLVIKNYTGDVLNFEMAKDMAAMDDLEVDYVVVNDDIALENSEYTIGKRGIAGTIFVHKIAGALAETGASLAEVKKVAQKVIDNLASYGMSLDGCTIPANGKKSFEIGQGEVEIGLGIHGEKGTHRESLKTADQHTEQLFNFLLKHHNPKKGQKVALMVNGLGATPLMEQYIIARKVSELAKKHQLEVVDFQVGNFMTSIDMPGFSLTMLLLDKEMESLLKAKANTPALKVVK